jgi:hypothetical protein
MLERVLPMTQALKRFMGPPGLSWVRPSRGMLQLGLWAVLRLQVLLAVLLAIQVVVTL